MGWGVQGVRAGGEAGGDDEGEDDAGVDDGLKGEADGVFGEVLKVVGPEGAVVDVEVEAIAA